ncbi:hypothetical protein RJ639_022817 [Escallonia herrerae]|uniref:Uncharacterized protein n=1 Tax=Escallonia herrerae TaxID=1293975 RepID=A0AA88V098_9ASTE|nr:hypothetical protein RJ639_022817 [Escallonia herrerae]
MELVLSTTAFNKLVCLLVFVPLVLDGFSGFGSVAQLLPEEEGVLPAEFANLSYLREMSLLGNRISGSIPKEIGDIATLEVL